MARMRRGVTHEKCLCAMYARVPDTLAPAVIAVAMHCMHMARKRTDPSRCGRRPVRLRSAGCQRHGPGQAERFRVDGGSR